MLEELLEPVEYLSRFLPWWVAPIIGVICGIVTYVVLNALFAPLAISGMEIIHVIPLVGSFVVGVASFAVSLKGSSAGRKQRTKKVSRTRGVSLVGSPTSHESNSSFGICPRCGSPLVQRVAKRGPQAGNTFIGCSAYPRCRYTRND